MDAPSSPPRRERPVRQPILLGLFAGVGVAVGYLLAGVPGVELMTLTACLAGIALGPARGALAGGLAEAIYSVGSPYGLAAPPLLVAQILGVVLAGVLGGLAAKRLTRPGGGRRTVVLAGGLGVVTALVFDVLTNLGIMAGYGLEWWVLVVQGAGMAAVHATANLVVFGAVLPVAAPRVAVLGRGALRGGPTAGLALVLLLTAAVPGRAASAQEPVAAAADTALAPAVADTLAAAPAAADSTAGGRRRPQPPPADQPAAPPKSGPATLGWKRPLWQPFTRHALEWLDWHSPRVVVAEAGTGAPAYVLGEAGTSPLPLVTVDGVPWGTGHALADDPWLIPQQGLRWTDGGWFADGLGGTDGRLALVTADPDPARSVSAYMGTKGPHESYMRGVDLLTAAAPWRVGFAFDELLDNESWDYTDGQRQGFVHDPIHFSGNAKVRQSRTRLQRVLDADNRLTLDFSTGRKTRNDVPSWGVDQQEIWDAGVSATMDGTAGDVAWRGIAYWRDRDVMWADLTDSYSRLVRVRKLETGREGIILDLRPRDRSAEPDSLGLRGPSRAPLADLRLSYLQWSVFDRSDTLSYLRPPLLDPALLGPASGRGRQVRVEATEGARFGPHRLVLTAGGTWDERIDTAPSWRAVLEEDAARPRWHLELAGDGRAPRSDELLTTWRRYVTGRNLLLLANEDLGREHTVRAGLVLRTRLLGTDLALDAAARRLTDGITWVALPGEVVTRPLAERARAGQRAPDRPHRAPGPPAGLGAGAAGGHVAEVRREKRPGLVPAAGAVGAPGPVLGAPLVPGGRHPGTGPGGLVARAHGRPLGRDPHGGPAVVLPAGPAGGVPPGGGAPVLGLPQPHGQPAAAERRDLEHGPAGGHAPDVELPPLGDAGRGGGLPRREALGLVLAFLLLLGGRWLRRRLLLGPDGRWRDDLWAADLLAADPADSAAAGPPPKPRLTAPLPVNTCSEDSLTLLPGVGPRLAERLAAARREGGPFRDAADLQRVKGIGPTLAGRLGPLVDFGTAPAAATPSPRKSP